MLKDLNRVDKRAIEALAVVPIIEAVSPKIGREAALSIFREVNEKEAFERGREMAKKMGRNDIEALVEEVASWGVNAVWETEVLEQSKTTYFFNVTRCPYAEKYQEIGLKEYGVYLSCCRDEPFARGFNPELKLVRTKTIMEGAPHCDFRYFLADV